MVNRPRLAIAIALRRGRSLGASRSANAERNARPPWWSSRGVVVGVVVGCALDRMRRWSRSRFRGRRRVAADCISYSTLSHTTFLPVYLLTSTNCTPLHIHELHTDCSLLAALPGLKYRPSLDNLLLRAPSWPARRRRSPGRQSLGRTAPTATRGRPWRARSTRPARSALSPPEWQAPSAACRPPQELTA